MFLYKKGVLYHTITNLIFIIFLSMFGVPLELFSKPFRYLWPSLNRTELSQNLTLWGMDIVSR